MTFHISATSLTMKKNEEITKCETDLLDCASPAISPSLSSLGGSAPYIENQCLKGVMES